MGGQALWCGVESSTCTASGGAPGYAPLVVPAVTSIDPANIDSTRFEINQTDSWHGLHPCPPHHPPIGFVQSDSMTNSGRLGNSWLCRTDSSSSTSESGQCSDAARQVLRLAFGTSYDAHNASFFRECIPEFIYVLKLHPCKGFFFQRGSVRTTSSRQKPPRGSSSHSGADRRRGGDLQTYTSPEGIRSLGRAAHPLGRRCSRCAAKDRSAG